MLAEHNQAKGLYEQPGCAYVFETDVKDPVRKIVKIMKGKYQNVDMRYEIMEIYEMSIA